MRLKSVTALLAAFLMCVATGCASLGGGCGPGGCASPGCGPVGCDSYGGGCFGGGCLGGDPANCVTPETLAADGYGNRGGYTGPLSGFIGQHHRGPQSHMGGMPGPADGPPVAQVTYPYYTTRGPRDFFAANPPSIGP